jgi:hypothetical protein
MRQRNARGDNKLIQNMAAGCRFNCLGTAEPGPQYLLNYYPRATPQILVL